jgi:predicted RNA-binding Zn-ribbon protein involved in translation (DUF1610 family)
MASGFLLAAFGGRFRVMSKKTMRQGVIMSERLSFFCYECGKTLISYSDGNPFYLDEAGRKRYAHYPDAEKLDRCIGNDLPHICLSCGDRFVLDATCLSKHVCPKCNAFEVIEVRNLWAEKCPYCKMGYFLFGQPEQASFAVQSILRCRVKDDP